ncbi:MAG: hypothetical protein WCH98_20405, partial [Verrucomicrobiota bacterium]
PSAPPPQMDESKPLVQDLSEPIPKVHYLEDERFRHEHHVVAVAVTFIFLALAGIAVVFSLRHDDDGTPVYAAVPGALPSREETADTPDKIIKKASRAFLSGEKDRANQLLADVDLAQAASPLAWELVGMLKQDAGDSKAAMEIYSRGIAAAPSEWLFYRRAILHRASGDLDLALEDMNRATASPPVQHLLSNERLLLLIQMGRQDQARTELQALKARNAEPAGWIFGLCGMALQDGEYQEAGRLIASGKLSADPSVFQQILKNPVLSRHQARPELMPFYFSNLPKK